MTPQPTSPPHPLHPRPLLRLSCVVPAYNEAGHLAEFLQALHACASALTPDFEILVVNDGSRDNTREVTLAQAEKLGVRYLEFSRNFGKEAALSAGIDHARGNAILLIDSDFQHPLELVPRMVDLWRSGYDMVYGVITDRAAESGLKRLGTDVFYRLMGFGSDIHIPRNAGDFRLMDRKVVQALKALPERNRFMKGLYAWVGFQTVALPFVPADRHSGQSSFNLRRLGSLALLGMTSFTTLPLRFWGVAGACLSVLAIVYGLWIALETLLFGNPLSGWPTLAASVLLFSGIQLLSIGILGEYIGRIYEEVKGRPVYLLAQDEDHSPLAQGGKPTQASDEAPAP
ncbi:MAG: glycosyltransferase family 2 protein [Giesbergeria sp.]|nr:glycosyltransferase family 2 protein [Giesbergeria sp.]MBP6321714.1 glycosyltransferase family 2 protein [Giesbergeria sp.]MBP7916420.1 glycosyltransferase family 2 protein [Giesbergeria sp.]